MRDELRQLFLRARFIIGKKFRSTCVGGLISYKRSGALPRKPSVFLTCLAISYAVVC